MTPATTFTRLLMYWHRTLNRREMPWKGERDPYRVWLSEVILQQTRVEQGRAYYERFLAAFPTLSDLAAAPDDEVFKAWEGLGYYSRCRNLLSTARFIMETLGGSFPTTHEGILALRGVGPYTAAAIASFAFGLPHAVVDGNVIRVLARYDGIREAVDRPEVRRNLTARAQDLLDRSDPAGFNQAIMDFGATVCRPRSPACGACPLSEYCQARAAGQVDSIPAKAPKPGRKVRWLHYIHAEHGEHTLVRERTGKDIWRHLNEFWLVETPSPLSDAELAALPLLHNLPTAGLPQLSEAFRQQLTHQEIRGRFVRVMLSHRIPAPEGFRWLGQAAMASAPFPKFILTYLQNCR